MRPRSFPSPPDPIDIAALRPPFAPTDGASAWLFRLHRLGIRPGLESISQVLDRMNHPEQACPAVVVGGTNGKGSSAIALAALLRSCGCRVGLYTSPHFLRIHERIRVDGRPIREADLFALVSEYRGLLERSGTTFFESLTALAFEHFRRERCDLVVLEAGLGGRLDATNVARKIGVVLTSVGLDHQDLLGATEEAIATEKLGLAQADVPLYLLSTSEPLLSLARARAEAVECDLVEVDSAAVVAPRDLHSARQRRNYRRLAAVAVDLTRRLDLPMPDFERAAELHHLPGRYELRGRAPELRLDSAHNAHALLPLLEEFTEAAGQEGPRVLVWSATEGKTLDGVVAVAKARFDHVLCVAPAWPRAVDPLRLAASFEDAEGDATVRALPSVVDGLEMARRLAVDGRVLVCGSNFLVAEALDRLGVDDVDDNDYNDENLDMGASAWDSGAPLRRRGERVLEGESS